MRNEKFVFILLVAFLAVPVLALADHNTAHTIQQLQEQIRELQAKINALRPSQSSESSVSSGTATGIAPSIKPIRLVPTVMPIFDEDTSDDDIIQLNNLRISSISGSELPAVISAYPDFGVRCLEFKSQDALSGIAIPCPVPPSVRYQIRVDSDTLLLFRSRQRAKISDFEVGNRINVYGWMDRDTNSIDALIVRNLDNPSVKQFIQLNNVEVIQAPSSSVPPSTLVVIERHRFPCFDYGESGTGNGAPFPCPLGVETKVLPRTAGGGVGGN